MKKNRILSIILSVMMLLTIIIPIVVFAEQDEAEGYAPEVEEMVVEPGEEENTAEEPVVVPVEEIQEDDHG